MKDKTFTRQDLINYTKWKDFVLIDISDAPQYVDMWIENHHSKEGEEK